MKELNRLFRVLNHATISEINSGRISPVFPWTKRSTEEEKEERFGLTVSVESTAPFATVKIC